MEMNESFMDGVRELGNYRMLIAIGLPVFGSLLAVAATVLVPRGKAKGFFTGAYMLLASLGAACLVIALIAAAAGEPVKVLIPLLVPGITLTVIMGIFSPEIIREYQRFEVRKLAAELFRRG
jgi:peptidoglycan/LPS O-acetylase OafA/YrhL